MTGSCATKIATLLISERIALHTTAHRRHAHHWHTITRLLSHATTVPSSSCNILDSLHKDRVLGEKPDKLLHRRVVGAHANDRRLLVGSSAAGVDTVGVDAGGAKAIDVGDYVVTGGALKYRKSYFFLFQICKYS